MTARETDEHASGQPTVRVYLVVFGALLALLAVTVGAAEIDLGRANLLAAVMIASVKAGLILFFFMHLGYSNNLVRLFAAASLYWLGLLIGLTLLDYFTRG